MDPLDCYSSAFGLEEYLKALLAKPDCDIAAICAPQTGVDSAAWLYELVRRICMDMNQIVVALGKECKCQVMSAQDFEYLCAVHGRPQMCSALAYAHHTLDHSIAQLTDPSAYPSRLSVSQVNLMQCANSGRHSQVSLNTQTLDAYIQSRILHAQRSILEH